MAPTGERKLAAIIGCIVVAATVAACEIGRAHV